MERVAVEEKPINERARNQTILEQVEDIAPYSVCQWMIWMCVHVFLHFQEIKDLPRNMLHHVVERREFGQLAQSASP